MSLLLKQFIIIVLIILAALSIYFGSALPVIKSTKFITGLQALSNVKSIGEFENVFDSVFNFYSPVGDEETAKFLGSDILNFVSQQQTEAASRALVDYIEPKLSKNNTRHLLMLAQMYAALWKKFHQEADYGSAEKYFLQARAIGPKLPPVLYGLLDLYQTKGDKEKVRGTAEEIIRLWPEDEKVKQALNDL